MEKTIKQGDPIMIKYVVATQPKHYINNGNPINTCKFIKKANIKYIETSIKDFTKHIDQCSFTWDEIKKIPRKEISEKYSEWIFYPASEFKHLTTQKLDKILDDIVWPEAR